MQIVEVLTTSNKKEFHDFPKRLYKDDPCWVCPLDSEIEALFNPAKNHTFMHGEAIRWILKDENEKTLGRVAAFIDNVRSSANRQPTGGLGFFEVIENREAAFRLFDTAKEWLASRGMEAMDGPVNFGENDSNWGLLVDGFIQQGYGMPFNKKYYRDFFEAYGFRNYIEQYSYHREVRNEKGEYTVFPERLLKVAEWISKRPGYSFRHFEFRNSRKYIDDVCEIYNTAWPRLKDDFTPIVPEFLKESIQRAKMVIDEETIIFIYNNDKPIGFWIMLPDLNQILKHFNGKLNLWNLIRFIYYKMTHEMTRLRTAAGGIIHSHQNSGLEAAVFYRLYQVLKKKPWIKEIEISWVGDYNFKMMATSEALGAVKMKTHITYRYLINDKLNFMRYKDEMAEKQQIKHKNKKESQ